MNLKTLAFIGSQFSREQLGKIILREEINQNELSVLIDELNGKTLAYFISMIRRNHEEHKTPKWHRSYFRRVSSKILRFAVVLPFAGSSAAEWQNTKTVN